MRFAEALSAGTADAVAVTDDDPPYDPPHVHATSRRASAAPARGTGTARATEPRGRPRAATCSAPIVSRVPGLYEKIDWREALAAAAATVDPSLARTPGARIDDNWFAALVISAPGMGAVIAQFPPVAAVAARRYAEIFEARGLAATCDLAVTGAITVRVADRYIPNAVRHQGMDPRTREWSYTNSTAYARGAIAPVELLDAAIPIETVLTLHYAVAALVFLLLWHSDPGALVVAQRMFTRDGRAVRVTLGRATNETDTHDGGFPLVLIDGHSECEGKACIVLPWVAALLWVVVSAHPTACGSNIHTPLSMDAYTGTSARARDLTSDRRELCERVRHRSPPGSS